jgi:hypothetical protein
MIKIYMGTVILQCNEKNEPDVRSWIFQVQRELQQGESLAWTWSCGRVRKIQVGDRIFLQRTGNPPRGYFASGYTTSAVEEEQLRLQDPAYQDLSEAYHSSFYGSSFKICFNIDSIVNFDFPLQIDYLQSLPQFEGCKFIRFGSGTSLDSDYAQFLEEEWEKHAQKLSSQGLGARPESKVNSLDLSEDLLDESFKHNANHFEEQVTNIQTNADDISSIQEAEILKSKFGNISGKERETVIQARRGQGLFRKQVIDYWSTCAVTGCVEHSLLRASHIKPWAQCCFEEALDPFNGLLLSPSIDATFDAGYISFDDSGKILISDYLSRSDAQVLGLHSSLCLSKIHSKHQYYLSYHRQNIFRF